MNLNEAYIYLQHIRHETGKEHLSEVFATKLDVYSCFTKPSVIGQVYLYEVLREIQHNIHPTIMLLEKKIMINGKLKENPKYVQYKEKMEAVCYPATFDGYMKLIKLKKITNLMFLDIDGFKSKQEALAYREKITFKYDWIIACNLSVSRTGLHIVIKVDQILDSPDYNFKYEYISKHYFEGLLDKRSKSLARYTIIPFDSSIYINEVPSTLPIHTIINNAENPDEGLISQGLQTVDPGFLTPESVPPSEIKKKKGVSAIGVRFNNFTNLSGYDHQGLKYSNAKNIVVVEARIGIGLSTGMRNVVLSSYANNLLCLNPWMEKQYFSKYIHRANQNCFLEPLGNVEVIKIITSKYKALNDNELSPIYTKRMIIFHPTKCNLSKEEKNNLVISILAQTKKMKSRNKIYAILENWDHDTHGKISIRNISRNYPVSKKTVAKYYGEFQSFIESMNRDYMCREK